MKHCCRVLGASISVAELKTRLALIRTNYNLLSTESNSAGFDAHIGTRTWISCSCPSIKSFIFNQMEACQEFRHLLSNADKTLQLIPRWRAGIKVGSGSWCDASGQPMMSYMKRLSQHGGNICEHFLVYHPTFKAGGYLMEEQAALPSRLIIVFILQCIAAESRSKEPHRGSIVMRMNLGINVGTQRCVLTAQPTLHISPRVPFENRLTRSFFQAPTKSKSGRRKPVNVLHVACMFSLPPPTWSLEPGSVGGFCHVKGMLWLGFFSSSCHL